MFLNLVLFTFPPAYYIWVRSRNCGMSVLIAVHSLTIERQICYTHTPYTIHKIHIHVRCCRWIVKSHSYKHIIKKSSNRCRRCPRITKKKKKKTQIACNINKNKQPIRFYTLTIYLLWLLLCVCIKRRPDLAACTHVYRTCTHYAQVKPNCRRESYINRSTD